MTKDFKTKIFYSVIRLLILSLIISCIVKYYNNQIVIYEEKLSVMESSLEEHHSSSFLQQKAVESHKKNETELISELTSATQKIEYLEKRWDVLVRQKNNIHTRSVTSPNNSFSHYIGDVSTKVFHKINCDLLDAINETDKVAVDFDGFSCVQGYVKCDWCFE